MSAPIGSVVILGGGGFLGLEMARHFHREGWRAVLVGRLGRLAVERELLDSKRVAVHGITLPDERLAEILRREQPTAVIFSAGTSQVGPSMTGPLADFENTVGINAYCLEAVRVHSPRSRYVFLSSAAVYGNPERLPIGEGTAVLPVSPYGFHKAASELVVREYDALFGIAGTILRIFSAYGDGLRKQVIHDICRQFADPARSTVELKGTGNESRDFIHASDIARAVEAASLGRLPGICNLASGTETTIRDLAATISRHFGDAKPVRFSQAASSGDPLNWRADVTRLSQAGLLPKVPLADGLGRYVAWFQAVGAVPSVAPLA